MVVGRQNTEARVTKMLLLPFVTDFLNAKLCYFISFVSDLLLVVIGAS